MHPPPRSHARPFWLPNPLTVISVVKSAEGERETTESRGAAFQSRSSLCNPTWKYAVGLDHQMVRSPTTSAPPPKFISDNLMLSSRIPDVNRKLPPTVLVATKAHEASPLKTLNIYVTHICILLPEPVLI